MLKYVVCLCSGCDVLMYRSVFSMQMLYVCVLCVSCGSFQCCVLHDLPFVNAGGGCKRHTPELVL